MHGDVALAAVWRLLRRQHQPWRRPLVFPCWPLWKRQLLSVCVCVCVSGCVCGCVGVCGVWVRGCVCGCVVGVCWVGDGGRWVVKEGGRALLEQCSCILICLEPRVLARPNSEHKTTTTTRCSMGGWRKLTKVFYLNFPFGVLALLPVRRPQR